MDTAILRRAYIINGLTRGDIPEVEGLYYWYKVSDDNGPVGSVRVEMTDYIMLVHVAATAPTKSKLLSLRTATHEINEFLCDRFGYDITHVASNKPKFVKYLTNGNYKVVEEDFIDDLTLYSYERTA